MSSKSADNVPGPWLAYDGECPFCTSYVRMVRLRESVGTVRLVDAREGGAEFGELTAAGYDINTGMVLKLEDQLYHGDACINRIAMLTTGSGAFNRVNAWVFRSRARSRMLYPAMKAGRGLVLRLLGRRPIPPNTSI